MLWNELVKHRDALFTQLFCSCQFIGVDHNGPVELHLACRV